MEAQIHGAARTPDSRPSTGPQSASVRDTVDDHGVRPLATVITDGQLEPVVGGDDQVVHGLLSVRLGQELVELVHR